MRPVLGGDQEEAVHLHGAPGSPGVIMMVQPFSECIQTVRVVNISLTCVVGGHKLRLVSRKPLLKCR